MTWPAVVAIVLSVLIVSVAWCVRRGRQDERHEGRVVTTPTPRGSAGSAPEQAPARETSTLPAPGLPDPDLTRALLEDSLRTSAPLGPSQRALTSAAFTDLLRSATAERLGRGKASVTP